MAYATLEADQLPSFGGTMTRDGARELAGYLRFGHSAIRKTIAEFLLEFTA